MPDETKMKTRVKIQGIVIQANGPEGLKAGFDLLGAFLGAVLAPVTREPTITTRPKRIKK